MTRALHLGIVGDFERTRFSHWATEAALFHAATQLGQPIELHWLGTDQVTSSGAERCLLELDGLWGAPGGPFASNDGMVAAIRQARETGLPPQLSSRPQAAHPIVLGFLRACAETAAGARRG
ncbi:MAG: hypothetical protein ABI895_21365 [Deltaproteobacteria bacterium]